MTRKLKRTSGAVKHHLPHRTRLRIPHNHRTAHTLQAVEKQLKKVPGVKTVEVNHRTGSVLVEHEERDGMVESFGDALNEVASELFEAVLEVEGVEIPGLSIFAHLIRKNLSKADTDLALATSNWLDLKMLVPVVLFGAGYVKAQANKGWWGEVPAWVLFYYAYDSYMKFHGPSVREVSATERVETVDGVLENPMENRKVRRLALETGNQK